MKRKWVLAVALASTSLVAANSYAVDWKYCKKEIDKFCKRVKGKSDRKIYECLSEHDEHHDNGLSEECDKKAHTQYEIENGITDPNEGKKE
jgi:hypothetical protein